LRVRMASRAERDPHRLLRQRRRGRGRPRAERPRRAAACADRSGTAVTRRAPAPAPTMRHEKGVDREGLKVTRLERRTTTETNSDLYACGSGRRIWTIEVGVRCVTHS